MTSPKSSLATLLVISAIDLLLCCFTMGVMLFLVLQSSQRTDVSRSQLLAIGGRDAIAATGAGLLVTPAVIILDNLGSNRAVAVDLPSAFHPAPFREGIFG